VSSPATATNTATTTLTRRANDFGWSSTRVGAPRTGAQVDVGRKHGTTAAFTVDRIRFPKTTFPTAQVCASTTNRAELRLITCCGSFDKQGGNKTTTTWSRPPTSSRSRPPSAPSNLTPRAVPWAASALDQNGGVQP